MLRISTLGGCLALLGLCLASGRVSTVEDLKAEKYLGRWYQVYTDKINALTFEKDACCITADYVLAPNGSIAVHNSDNLRTPDGEVNSIEGTAMVPDPEEPGKLAVSLDGAPSGADYWVVGLGPETHGDDGLYEWAVVTDRLKATLFILSRDPETFDDKFGEEVLELVENLGFTSFLNKPLKVRHEGCTYKGHEPSFALGRPSRPYAVKTSPNCSIPTVDEVDRDAYTGRWYQVFTNYIVQYTFELFGVCATADYAPVAAGISVHNSQNLFKASGPISSINGFAYAKNASEPGKLTVNFRSVPFPGSYWIIKLGPIVKGSYQYAVITDEYSTTLFILARDVAKFQSDYEQEVLDFVNPLFTGWLYKPRRTEQGPQCAYSPAPNASLVHVPDMEGEGEADVSMKRFLLRH